MTRLPVIVGFGGVGPAGRSSFHHAYHRIIWESIDSARRQRTVTALAAMMNLGAVRNGQLCRPDGSPFDQAGLAALEATVLGGTLIRRLENDRFDPDQVTGNAVMAVLGEGGNVITVASRDLPDPLPPGWRVLDSSDGKVSVAVAAGSQLVVETRRKLAVQSGGQLPSGFDPAALYPSRFHPRGLQLAIIASSDAVRSTGIEWQTIVDAVHPDEIGVYAASAMAQLDGNGTGGMLQARLRGNRVSSKQLPLGLNTMPADFVNAYVLGSVGATGANAGACATFLYNLRLAVEDIQSGRRRVVVVGNAEAPLLPEVIEGYAAMSALATDSDLCRLDGVSVPDYRRASRPFGDNCGFTLGESGQYFVLMDDSLALQLGAQVHGAVSDVFVNADGFKKSISAPGPGNYITLAKAVAGARAMFGDDVIRNRSFVQAHGSSTPQNRTTESRIMNLVAGAFGIEDWPVTAIKAFVGHSLAPASADQMTVTLGVLRHGVMPGIKTVDKLADDLEDSHLAIALKDVDLGDRAEVAFLNSKGFGGNNATGTVISPRRTEAMLAQRHGAQAMAAWRARQEAVLDKAQAYDAECLAGPMQPIYRFGDALIEENEITIDTDGVHLPGFAHEVDLHLANRYGDMCK
ncbi:MAG: beta-ketoacyl synthase [Proteobacteria bacterium]|nr:beta-ketoacyl synthase [Pseudomonadota bacterium]